MSLPIPVFISKVGTRRNGVSEACLGYTCLGKNDFFPEDTKANSIIGASIMLGVILSFFSSGVKEPVRRENGVKFAHVFYHKGDEAFIGVSSEFPPCL